jgi:hypothetical protein
MNTYESWISAVNTYLSEHHGVVLDDLPDMPTRDWHADGMTAEDAAKRAVLLAQEY